MSESFFGFLVFEFFFLLSGFRGQAREGKERNSHSFFFLAPRFETETKTETKQNRSKIGQYHVMVCGTTPCRLAGAELVMKAISER